MGQAGRLQLSGLIALAVTMAAFTLAWATGLIHSYKVGGRPVPTLTGETSYPKCHGYETLVGEDARPYDGMAKFICFGRLEHVIVPPPVRR